MNEPPDESSFYKYFAEFPLNLKIWTGTSEKRNCSSRSVKYPCALRSDKNSFKIF